MNFTIEDQRGTRARHTADNLAALLADLPKQGAEIVKIEYLDECGRLAGGIHHQRGRGRESVVKESLTGEGVSPARAGRSARIREGHSKAGGQISGKADRFNNLGHLGHGIG